MTKIAFFGTSDRSVPILEALKANFDLTLCVTKEDVLIGRNQILKEVEVKRWARENGVKYVTISKSLKEEKDTIIEQIVSSKPEIGVVADFGYIITQEVLDVFPQGLINIHFSLLPQYRGASPVQFAILNGDKETGVTYQLMDKGLDTGPVLQQLPYPLNGNESSGKLYETLFKLVAENLFQVVQKYLTKELKPKPQDDSHATYTYSPTHPKSTFIYKEDAKIAWFKPVNLIESSIRAYNPWPIAWTTLQDLEKSRYRILGSTEIKDHRNDLKKVKIYSAKIQNDLLLIKEIQLEGGRVITWDQFSNGFLKSN